jgi:hypothetical protein
VTSEKTTTKATLLSYSRPITALPMNQKTPNASENTPKP